MIKKIPYQARKFPLTYPVALHGSHRLDVSWVEIVWAAITVGKRDRSVLLAHGWYSVADLFSRALQIYAYLRSSTSRFEPTDLFKELDPSEKGAGSYALGMTMAKLFADKLLDTPWLVHVSVAKKTSQHAIKSTSKSKSLPDLIGLNLSNEWIVVEAKGRSHGFNNEALENAKKQTSKIRTIDGKVPILRVAAQAYLEPSLEVVLEDPDEATRDAVDLDIPNNQMFKAYYKPVENFLRGAVVIQTIAGVQYRLREDPVTGITIGLRTDLDKWLVQSVLGGGLTHQPSGTLISETEGSFRDGVYVDLGPRWGHMHRMPEERPS